MLPGKRPLHKDPNLRIIFGVALLVVLGVASVTPAFPRMAEGLNISEREVGLLITFYTLPGVLLAPLLGLLADRLGRKKVLFPSLLLFGFAGAACSLGRELWLLLILRFLQGIGAASLAFLNLTLIGDLYSGRERSRAVGYNEGIISATEAAYPLLGGMLAALGWYYPFLLSLLALPIGFLVLFYLKTPEPVVRHDLKGYLRYGSRMAREPGTVALFVAVIATFMVYFGVFHAFFPFLMNSSFSAPSSIIGVFMSLAFLAAAVTSSQLGRLVGRYSEVGLIRAAWLLYALALALIPVAPLKWLLLPVLIYGTAQGINLSSLLSLLAGFAPREQRAGFLSMNWTVIRLGQTVGPLLMGAIFALGGLKLVFYSGAALSLAMFILVSFYRS